jgi:hypothetical protein
MLFKGITAAEARKNHDEFYRNAAKNAQKFYDAWDKKILEASKQGRDHIATNKMAATFEDGEEIYYIFDDADCVITVSPQTLYVNDILEYYKEKGFCISKDHLCEYSPTFYFTISW